MRVFLTVDLEQDCPPYLSTWRGMEEGAPRLLQLFREKQVPATFFTTGEVARRFPQFIEQLVADGHELAAHGDQHRRFDRLSSDEAADEIAASTQVLRSFYPTVSFRAPNLRFPPAYLPLLRDAGYAVDSSQGRYSSRCAKISRSHGLTRVPASVTSSVLRLPWMVRRVIYECLIDPVVLFVHPWEFVDFRRSQLRLDCRFRTGSQALECLGEAVTFFQERGARFGRMRELADAEPSRQ